MSGSVPVFAKNQLLRAQQLNDMGSYGGAVRSVAGRTGNVTLQVADVTGAAPLDGANLTGNVRVPTAAPGTNSTTAASTAFVMDAIAAVGSVVSSVLGATGVVTLANLVGGGVAPLTNPLFTNIVQIAADTNGEVARVYGRASDSRATIGFLDATGASQRARLGVNAVNDFRVQLGTTDYLILGTAGVSVPVVLRADATSASTTPTTGALLVAGGLGVVGAINAGSDIQAQTATTARVMAVSSAADALMAISAPAAQNNQLQFRDGTVTRWSLQRSASTANFAISAFDATGVALGSALSIFNASRVVNFAVVPTIGNALFRTAIGAQPVTIQAAGPGQFVPISSTGTVTLPAGGTWTYALQQITSGGLFVSFTSNTGVPGGTPIALSPAPNIWVGWLHRDI